MALRKKLSKKIIAIIAAIIVIGAIITVVVIANSRQEITQSEPDKNAPTFDAALPSGKTIVDLGGWRRLDPPNGDVFYVFTDSIKNVSINVSQQPMPDSFNGSVDTVARDYSATETFDANGIKVYIGANVNGQQSVIFTKNDLLILIVSQGKIENDAWKQYISSLT